MDKQKIKNLNNFGFEIESQEVKVLTLACDSCISKNAGYTIRFVQNERETSCQDQVSESEGS